MSKLMKNEKGRLLIGAIALAAVIVLCAVLPMLRFDVTGQKVMTPDPQVISLLKAAEERGQSVEMYYIANSVEDDMWLSELLRRYAEAGAALTVETVASTSSRVAKIAAMTHGETLDMGSIVIACGDRTVVLPNSELYYTEYDQMTYYYTGQLVPSKVEYAAQTALYNGINYAIRDDMPVIYLTTGHGETGLDGTIYSLARQLNAEVRTLNLAETRGVPEDAALVVVCGPTVPVSAAECAYLKTWMGKGGDLLLMTDYNSDLSNLLNLTRYYGMDFKSGVVMDNDAAHLLTADYKYYLRPELAQTDFTASMMGMRPIMPLASAIVAEGAQRDGLTVEALLTTSEQAYLKADPAAMTSLEQQDGDEAGQFTVAMVAAEGDTHLTWLGSAQAITTSAVTASSGGSAMLFSAIVSAAAELPENVTLASADLITAPLSLPALPAAAGLLALPVILLVIGLILRKRH